VRYTRPKTKQDLGVDFHFEDDGPVVPTTHAAIHNHSWPNPHPPWVWIMKSSIVDGDGRLGFLATEEEIHRYRVRATKVFLHQPPSNLHKSFIQTVEMGREDNQHQRPWKRRGDEE
jgi:hypothetical protein